jgi:hypothetical protein
MISSDPRKRYAQHHMEKCSDLPLHLRLALPRCKKELKDIVIPHHHHRPHPKPGPKPPPTPPVPRDFHYLHYNPSFITDPNYMDLLGAGIGTFAGGRLLDRAVRGGRAVRPRRALVADLEERNRGPRIRRQGFQPMEDDVPDVVDDDVPEFRRGLGTIPQSIENRVAPPTPDVMERGESDVRFMSGQMELPRAGGEPSIRGHERRMSERARGKQPMRSSRAFADEQPRYLRDRTIGTGDVAMDIYSEGGSGGVARDMRPSPAGRSTDPLPRADPPPLRDERIGRYDPRGQGTEQVNRRGSEMRRRSLSQRTQGERAGPYGEDRTRTTSFRTDSAFDNPITSRDEVLDPTGEFTPTEPIDPDVVPTEEDGLLSLESMLPRGGRAPARPSVVRRAMMAMSPEDKIKAFGQHLNAFAKKFAPSAPETREVATDAERELLNQRSEVVNDTDEVSDLRQKISGIKSNISTDKSKYKADEGVETADETEFKQAQVLQEGENTRIENVTQQVDTAEEQADDLGDATDLDMGVGGDAVEAFEAGDLTAEEAREFGSGASALARVGGGVARGVGSVLRGVTAPLRAVQAVGDAVGKVGTQVLTRVGERVGGEIGARVGLGIARGVGLLASAGGIVTGGGIIDPVTDAIGAGLLLAMPMQMLGDYVYAQGQGETKYNDIDGATNMPFQSTNFVKFQKGANSQISKLMKGVPKDGPDGKWWKPSTIKAHSQDAYEMNEYVGHMVMQSMNHAQHPDKYNGLVSWTDGKKSGIVVPLTRLQIARAMATYKLNPDAFKNIDPKALEVMGLNPQMALGKASAENVPGVGYVPKNIAMKSGTTGYEGDDQQIKAMKNGLISNSGAFKSSSAGNYSNAFLSYANLKSKGVFASGNYDGNVNYFANNDPPVIDLQTYATTAQNVINNMVNPCSTCKTFPTKDYMQNQLAWFLYNNKVIDTGTQKPYGKPTKTLVAPQGDQKAQDALTQAKADIALDQSATEAQQGDLTTANNALSQETGAIQTLQTQINQLASQPQYTSQSSATNSQLQQYQGKANAYNLAIAQKVEGEEQSMSAYDTQYAQATNTPLNIPRGGTLTASQLSQFQTYLGNQITATGVTSYSQNQLANLPRATPPAPPTRTTPTGPSSSAPQAQVSQQGPTPSTSQTTSPSAPQTTTQPTASNTPAGNEPSASTTQQSQNVSSYF